MGKGYLYSAILDGYAAANGTDRTFYGLIVIQDSYIPLMANRADAGITPVAVAAAADSLKHSPTDIAGLFQGQLISGCLADGLYMYQRFIDNVHAELQKQYSWLQESIGCPAAGGIGHGR